MKTYTFHVSLPGTGRVWRKIELLASQTLEDLHFAIQGAYSWDADHLYSFFMSGKAWDEKTEYCLPKGYTPWGEPIDEAKEGKKGAEPAEQPEDKWEELPDPIPDQVREQLMSFLEKISKRTYSPHPGDVRKTKIEELNLKEDQEFMYLFDYGDDHRFKVRVHAINQQSDPRADYPRVVQSVGQPPRQYPRIDE